MRSRTTTTVTITEFNVQRGRCTLELLRASTPSVVHPPKRRIGHQADRVGLNVRERLERGDRRQHERHDEDESEEDQQPRIRRPSWRRPSGPDSRDMVDDCSARFEDVNLAVVVIRSLPCRGSPCG